MIGGFRRRVRVQHHPTIREILDLTDARAQPLATARPIDQPRGQRGGHLVGVAQPIGTDKAVMTEQPVEVPVHQRAVEDRNVILVTVRHIQIEQARLQGLDPGRHAEPVGVQRALEGQAAVHIEHGRGARRTVTDARRGILQPVMGVAEPGPRFEIGARPLQRPTHGRP